MKFCGFPPCYFRRHQVLTVNAVFLSFADLYGIYKWHLVVATLYHGGTHCAPILSWRQICSEAQSRTGDAAVRPVAPPPIRCRPGKPVRSSWSGLTEPVPTTWHHNCRSWRRHLYSKLKILSSISGNPLTHIFDMNRKLYWCNNNLSMFFTQSFRFPYFYSCKTKAFYSRLDRTVWWQKWEARGLFYRNFNSRSLSDLLNMSLDKPAFEMIDMCCISFYITFSKLKVVSVEEEGGGK